MTIVDRDEIVAQLKPAFLAASNGRANVDQLSEDCRIIEDVGLASLDLLELRCELEERWQTQITDEEAVQLKTIGDVVALIRTRVRRTRI